MIDETSTARQSSPKRRIRETLLTTYNLLLTTISFLLAPIFAIILTLSFIYRLAVSFVLRIQLGEKFVSLLDGCDNIWSIEDPSGLSVINILAILEKDDARHSNIHFLEKFRCLVKTRLLDSSFEKLLYTREKKFGYSFWRRNREIDLEERVRWLEYERCNSCDGSCDNIYSGHLKRILWNVCNEPLPDDHSASWEILVGKSCRHNSRRTEEGWQNGRMRIPILFRVHHSVGDGAALLRLFQETLVDRETEELLVLENSCSRVERNGGEFEGLSVPSLDYPETRLLVERSLLLSASMPFVHPKVLSNLTSLIEPYASIVAKVFDLNYDEIQTDLKRLLSAKWRRLRETLGGCLKMMKTYLKASMIVVVAPSCLIRQFFRSTDDSVLHGAKLSGEKLVSYWLEDDFKSPRDRKLIEKIRCIKTMTTCRFRDVILAGLSASLHKYFDRVNQVAPDKLSVVLPIRIDEGPPVRIENRSLENNFSVEVLSLCVSRVKGRKSVDPTEDSRCLDRIEDVKNASCELDRSLDRIVNFFAIKCLSGLLPEVLLRPILESRGTMIFSNIVGPRQLRILGHPLRNIAFWIPNRSRTGIGCSLFTYRGYVQLSLMADKALIGDEKLLMEILERTIDEIEALHERLTVSRFSKALYLANESTIPRKKEIGVL